MQKEDVQWVVLAIGILLVIALVIKPLATGQPVNVGIPMAPSPTPVATSPPPTPVTTPATTVIPTPTPTPLPTPTQTTTWSGAVQTIAFVDPSTYKVNLTESRPGFSDLPPPNASLRNADFMTYATFSGQYSGTTQVVTLPFPYWELWYTVDPWTSSLIQQGEVSGSYMITVTPTEGRAGTSMAGFQGSYSTAQPRLNIQVMDAQDPNRIVRTITPPGGIDPSIWTKNDPRPWKEKFYEGQRSYYFIIQASILKSYNIDIMIPTYYVNSS
jgi:hypothetical protein